MAVWTDDAGHPLMWFHMSAGNIVAKSPRPNAIEKVHEISGVLQARLMGEEGELYDAAGRARYPNAPEKDTQKAERNARPWWKRW